MAEKSHPRSALHVMEGIEPPDPVNPEVIRRIRSRKRPPVRAGELVEGILSGNRTLLSQAITLVESSLAADREAADAVIAGCLQSPGTGSVRIGITGVPGVGKSTFIEALGTYLTAQGHRVAVLAIDPSSTRSRGSILGDKTRMEELANDPNAFIRPSPSAGSLGGVARKTRETILLCEAAGFDVIFVETVGVGQSETAVHGMVDFFLLLMLAGAGDELQGIKRGIIEMADAIFIHKADGDNIAKAKAARREYANALHLFPPQPGGWTPVTDVCSSLTREGIDRVWQTVCRYREEAGRSGYFLQRRQEQNFRVLKETIEAEFLRRFYSRKEVAQAMARAERLIEKGKANPYRAAQDLLDTCGF